MQKTKHHLPFYNKIEPSDVIPGTEKILTLTTQMLSALEGNSNAKNWRYVQQLNEIEKILSEDLWGPLNHLLHVKHSEEMKDQVGKVTEDITKMFVKIEQSQKIYQGLLEIKESSVWDTLDKEMQRIVDKKLLNARLAGVHLEEKEKERFSEISQKLVLLSKDFTDNVMDTIKNYEMILENKDDISGLPESLLSLASHSYNEEKKDSGVTSTPEKGPWRITLDSPSLGPFLEYSDRRDLRKKLYMDYIQSGGEQNTDIMYEILKLRKEKAQLLGFKNYSEVSLATKMASSTEEVLKLLEELREVSWDPAVKDFEELKKYAAEKGEKEELKHWDIGYWAQKLKQEKYQYSDEELRKYFQMPKVLNGLFGLVENLFSVVVKECDSQIYRDIPLWHESCKFYFIYDKEDTNQPIAGFFLDPYVRPAEKRGGAWMDTAAYKTEANIPVAHIVCNGTPPLDGKPSLLSFRDVETLFHEFGHALQHMLARSNYVDGGIGGVEWDAVELPSQFMENWCYQKETLLGITEHVDTGEQLSDEFFNKIIASKNYRSGSAMLRQLLFGILDVTLHSSYDPEKKDDLSVFEVQRKITEKTSLLPMLPEDKFLTKFTHIFAGGYASGYYSYKWAEVMSADCFGAFEEAGLDNSEKVKLLGKKFRETILGDAGSKHASQVFQEFRGREPSPIALLRHNNLLKQ